MRSLKNTVESTPAVWVHGVISQIAEKPSGVYLSIAVILLGFVPFLSNNIFAGFMN